MQIYAKTEGPAKERQRVTKNTGRRERAIFSKTIITYTDILERSLGHIA